LIIKKYLIFVKPTQGTLVYLDCSDCPINYCIRILTWNYRLIYIDH